MDYQKNDKTWSYLHYNQFSVGSASEEYPLTVGGFTGVGTDRFAYHNGMKFIDNNDCANTYKCGWWYNGCYSININKQPPSDNDSVAGNLIFTEMKIRPLYCITCNQ